ncbi:MAG TPA: hypothetical protein VKE92_03335 [Anaerolineales bacterium]|nr:hypothetical protein [Anaerolineales bacterium]
MKPTVWNLQFHRTIQTMNGTQSQDVYTLRKADPNAAYYTVAIPHGQTRMMHEMFESINHRTVYEEPAALPEIEAIFHGPWHKHSERIGERYLIVTQKEVDTLRRTYHGLSAQNITIMSELDTLKKAYINLDRMYNLQSKVIQRLRHNNQPFEDEIARPDIPDLFKNNADFDRSVPQFEYGNPAARGPLATSKF